MEVLFDNESINNKFGIELAERPLIPIAEMAYETITVPGRDGSLTRELGYQSKSFSLRFNFIQKSRVKQKIREISNWLTDKTYLKLSDDMAVYRIIKKLNLKDATNDLKEYVDFEIELETDPFWYHDAGQITVTGTTTIVNPTAIAVDAKMRINGTGTCRVLLNENQMTFTDVQGYVQVEHKNASRNGISQNNSMSGQYPIFQPGQNKLTLGGQTTSVIVDLRWAYR